MGFLGGAVEKNLPANAGDAGDVGLISGSGRSLELVKGNPLQYSCHGHSPWGYKESDMTKHTGN